jgi:hypothetical protein
MVGSDEARSALHEIHARADQVSAELARSYPPWWVTLLLLAGHFTVLAGLDFTFPVPLTTAAAGTTLLVCGLVAGARHATTAVRGRRNTWSTRNIVLTGGWILGTYLTYALVRWLVAPVVADGLTSILAAAASTTIFAGMAGWLYRNTFGRRPTAEPVAHPVTEGPRR